MVFIWYSDLFHKIEIYKTKRSLKIMKKEKELVELKIQILEEENEELKKKLKCLNREKNYTNDIQNLNQEKIRNNNKKKSSNEANPFSSSFC
jgi:hypothetical protein